MYYNAFKLSILFCVFYSSTGLEDSDIIPIRVIGRPETQDEYSRSRVVPRRESSPRINRRSNGLVDEKCLKCICYGSTKCKAFGCDELGDDAYFCGPFQASFAYWKDGGSPTVKGGLSSDHKHAFEECLKDYNCSSRAVSGYMTKHQQDCNGDQFLDCYDFARIHKAGPYSCDDSTVENQAYWSQFLECMNNEVYVEIPNTQEATDYSPPRNDRYEDSGSSNSDRYVDSGSSNSDRYVDSGSSNSDRYEDSGSSTSDRYVYENSAPPREEFESQVDTHTSSAYGRLVDDQCLSCLCYANSKCELRGCSGAANICGPFQATWTYWSDGGKPTVPGGLAVDHPHSFEECLKDYNCSSRAVEGYMTKHQKDCDDNGIVDCYDFAKMHKGGAYSCPTEWLERQDYWKQFEDCMSGNVRFNIPYNNKVKPVNKVTHRIDSPPKRVEETFQTSGQTQESTSVVRKANIDDKCLRCICHASSKCQAKGCQNLGPESYFCGPFQATWIYWSDGGKPTVPGGHSVDHKHAFEECLKDYKCASKAVTGYMNKHHQDCNSDGVENCYDFARIHKAGPYSCGASWVENQAYWSQFLECMNDQVDVQIPGEAKVPTSTYNNNEKRRRPQNNIWKPPPTAGPYEAPPTVRPVSNARLPYFIPEQNAPRPSNTADHSNSFTQTQNNRRKPARNQVRRRPNRPSTKLVDEKCMQCLCYASSECEALECHNAGPESYFCGPFQATWAYWKEAGSPTVPGGLDASHKHAFEECLKDYDCAEQTVQGYMRKHQKDCNRDYAVDCYDFAKIHKFGPYTCNSTSIESTKYWTRLNDCMDGYVTFE